MHEVLSLDAWTRMWWTDGAGRWLMLNMLTGYVYFTDCTDPITVLPGSIISWFVGFCTLTMIFGTTPAFTDTKASQNSTPSGHCGFSLSSKIKIVFSLKGGTCSWHSIRMEACLGTLIRSFTVLTLCSLIKIFALFFFFKWGNFYCLDQLLLVTGSCLVSSVL